MRRITLYIGQVVALSTLVVMTIVLGLDLIFTLVNEIRYVGTGDYTLDKCFFYILTTIPQKAYQMFPMSALVGALMGLGAMASHSELIIMRSAGLSIQQISLIVLKTAFVLALIMWMIGEGVAPFTDKVGHDLKSMSLSGGQALKTSHGTWMRDGPDFVHIKSLYVGGHLEGITRYEFDQNQNLIKSSFASYADYVDKKWILYDIQETLFQDDKLMKHTYNQLDWDSKLTPSILSVVGEKYLDKLSLRGLWKTISYRKTNGLDPKPYQLALWSKIMQPFAAMIMMLLAIPFIFGPLRSTTMGLRLVTGILVGFCFHTSNELIGHLILVYSIHPAFGAILPSLLFGGLGLALTRRVF